MKEELMKKIGLEIVENEPLKKHTTFKIGGPAKFFVRVNNKADLFKAMSAVKEIGLPFFILGGGSNILISDKGFDGLVIKLEDGEMEIKKVEIEQYSVRAFAGNRLGALIRECVEKGLSGLEFAANIPGTIAGAIHSNAGAYGNGVGDFVKEVEIIIVGDKEVFLKILSKEECQFDYRESIFKKNKNWVIAEVTFYLEGQPEHCFARTIKNGMEMIQKEWEERRAKLPYDFPSAGCAFKNVVYTEELSKYKDWAVNGKMPAARFIDELGLKGKKIGGAMISDKHANFIINIGDATADDVAQLISLVKMKVRDEFGVQLEEEVQYIGF